MTRACKVMEGSVLQLAKTVDKLDGKIARIKIEADNTSANDGLDATERKRKDLDGKKATVKVDIDKKSFADAANSWAMLSRNMQQLALPAAIALAAPTLLDFANAAGVASQSLLLLPAAGAAAGITIGAVKLGVFGLSDAFKQVFAAKGNPEALALALAQLSPQAREFVMAVSGMKPAFESARFDVQDALLRGLSGTVKDLGGIYLPIMRTGLTGVATELNASAQNVGIFLRSAESTRDVTTIFANTRETMSSLVPAAGNIVAAFMDIATVGSEFLPGLGQGFTDLTERLDIFIAHARETGQLHDWIAAGLDALRQFMQIVINIGGIVSAVMRAAGTDTQDFLTIVVNGTAAVRAFLNSAEGQTALQTVFTDLRNLAAAVWPLLVSVGKAILDMFLQLAPAIPPLVQGLKDVFDNSGSLIGVFGQLAVAILPALGAGLSALAPILGPLLVIFTAMRTAMLVYNTTVAVVTTVTKAWGVAQAILNGTMALNPIGLVVTAVVALAAALIYAYNNSETFRNIVQAAWDGIKTAASTAWGILQAIFSGISTAMSAVSSGVSAFGQAFVDLWQNYIVPAWNGIVEAIKFAVALILTVIFAPLLIAINYLIPGGFEGLLATAQRVWAAIVAAVQIAWTAISGAWTALINFLSGPMTTTHNVFKALVDVVWAAIHTAIQMAWSIVQPIWNLMTATLVGPMSSGFRTFQAVVSAVWTAFQAAIAAGWNFVRDTVFNPMIKLITQTIPDGFRQGVDAVGRLWNSIKRALRDPLQAAIDIVWNHGIMTVWGAVTSLVGIPNNLHEVHLAPAASGRVVDTIPGYTPGRDPHTFYSPSANASIKLSGGESIMRPEFTTAVGPEQVNQINAVAKRGGTRAVQAFLAYGGEKLSDFGGFADGTAGLNWARSQVGKPYQMGAVGPRAYDCSGFQSAITNVIFGQYPYSRRFATGSFGPNRGAGGFVPGINGSYALGVNWNTGGGVGHMAGTLMGTNVESSGGVGVRVGGGARGADDGLFPWKFHLAEMGGQFVSGGGGGGPSAMDILTGAWKSVTDALGKLGSIGGGDWGDAAAGLLKKSAGAVFDFVKNKALAIMAAIGNAISVNAGPGGSFTGAGASFASAIGGGGAMQWIIQHESGGNPRAQNPTSSASGLFQMIDGTWRAYGGTTAHAKDASVAEQQAVASRYVASRYGSWENAQRFWMAHHYYDQGGYLLPGTTVATNLTGRPERILDPTQTRVWDAMASANRRGGDGGELLGEVRRLNANLMALRGDVDHHNDFGGVAARLDLTNRILSGAVSGSSAVGAQANRITGELGPF